MKVLTLVNGVPKMVEVTASVDLAYYDEEVYISTAIGVSGTNYDSDHLIITLPNSKAYVIGSNSLQVFMNGKLLQSDEYTETSTTTITLSEAATQYSRISFLITEVA